MLVCVYVCGRGGGWGGQTKLTKNMDKAGPLWAGVRVSGSLGLPFGGMCSLVACLILQAARGPTHNQLLAPVW